MFENNNRHGIPHTNFFILTDCIIFNETNGFSVGKLTQLSKKNYYKHPIQFLIFFFILNSYTVGILSL